MKRFDSKGMMLYPVPEHSKKIASKKSLLVVSECYCPEGHDLLSDRAIFDNFRGIVLKVNQMGEEGLVALSPVYGVKSRVSLNVALLKDRLLEIKCPECNTALPVFSPCSCGGNLVALFLDKKKDFTNCILVCNRVDCFNAQIRLHDEVVYYDGATLF
jgi:hypothetical protein